MNSDFFFFFNFCRSLRRTPSPNTTTKPSAGTSSTREWARRTRTLHRRSTTRTTSGSRSSCSSRPSSSTFLTTSGATWRARPCRRSSASCARATWSRARTRRTSSSRSWGTSRTRGAGTRGCSCCSCCARSSTLSSSSATLPSRTFSWAGSSGNTASSDATNQKMLIESYFLNIRFFVQVWTKFKLHLMAQTRLPNLSFFFLLNPQSSGIVDSELNKKKVQQVDLMTQTLLLLNLSFESVLWNGQQETEPVSEHSPALFNGTNMSVKCVIFFLSFEFTVSWNWW